MSPVSDNFSDTSETDSNDIAQLDGNISIDSSFSTDKISAAISLPTVATYNCRSLFPKVRSLKIDLIERNIELAFLVEFWEQEHKNEHKLEIEKMLELNGLQYISSPRPPNKSGVSHGGAAIVVNLEKFTLEKLNILTPKNLEVVWGLLQLKNPSARFKFFFHAPFTLLLIRNAIPRWLIMLSQLYKCCVQNILNVG